jgi:hypothetical protein
LAQHGAPLADSRAGGIVVFALAPNSSAVKAKLASPDAPVRGYLLVFANLAMDAYTNTTQDNIKSRFPATSPQQLMFYMNIWCTLYYAVYMFALPSNLLPGGLSFLPPPGARLCCVLLPASSTCLLA